MENVEGVNANCETRPTTTSSIPTSILRQQQQSKFDENKCNNNDKQCIRACERGDREERSEPAEKHPQFTCSTENLSTYIGVE